MKYRNTTILRDDDTVFASDDQWLKSVVASGGPEKTGDIVYTEVFNITSATVTWPDGVTGVYSATMSANGLFVTAFSVTHTGLGKRVVQGTMTIDELGNITSKPALTVETL